MGAGICLLMAAMTPAVGAAMGDSAIPRAMIPWSLSATSQYQPSLLGDTATMKHGELCTPHLPNAALAGSGDLVHARLRAALQRSTRKDTAHQLRALIEMKDPRRWWSGRGTGTPSSQ